MHLLEHLARAEQFDSQFWTKNAERLRGYRSNKVYLHYVQHSTQWKRKRMEKLQIVKRCEGDLCFSLGPYHIHHLTYDRLFEERMDDLCVLCPACHAAQHGKGKTVVDEALAV